MKNLLCVFGKHNWNGCVCKRCGEARDEQHDWDLCKGKCRKCGARQPEQHDWDLCKGKCKRCGKKRDEEHHWNRCKCTICGKKRNENHHWIGCKCTICGKTRNEMHDWDGCKCKRCGKKRDENHHWIGCKCTICGKTRNEMHDRHIQMNDPCSYCDGSGEVPNPGYVSGCSYGDPSYGAPLAIECPVCYGQSKKGDHVSVCSVCGSIEQNDQPHAWDGCKCAICGGIRNEQHDWEYVSSCEEQEAYDEVINKNCVEDIGEIVTSYQTVTHSLYRCKLCGKEENRSYRRYSHAT